MTLFGLSPFALVALIAGTTAALFVLHRLRVRPEVKRVPTLLFWREAVEETQARTLFGRFRHPRTFAFLCVLAALIAAAMADPMTDGARDATRHTVVVVDTSLTTTARRQDDEAGRTVGSAIREHALAILDEAGLRDKVAVVTTRVGGGLVAGFDTPRPVTREAVEALAPSNAPGDLEGALHRAATMLAGRSRPSVVFLAGPTAVRPMARDLADGESTRGAEGVPIRWVDHPADRTDQGLVGVRFTSTLEVRVAHHGPAAARTLEVHRRLDDGAAGERIAGVSVPFEGEVGARWVAIPGLAPDGTQVAIRLAGADGYAGNDRLAYQLPLRRQRRVYVDPTLPTAVGLLIAAHPRLTPHDGRDGAELSVLASKRLTVPAAAGARLHRPFQGGFADGADRKEMPILRAPVRSVAPLHQSNRLFSADGKMLAEVAGTRGVDAVIEVSPDLVQPGTGFMEDPAGAAALAEIVERSAGNRPGSVVAPGARAGVMTSGGIWTVRAGGEPVRSQAAADGVMALDGIAPALLLGSGDEKAAPTLAIHAPGLVPGGDAPADIPMPEVPSAPFRLWEWLALAALGFLLVDAWLHTRGRIP